MAAENIEHPERDRAPPSLAGGDTMQVSTRARHIAEANAVADQLPDFRADKIATARRRRASGFYELPEAQEILVDKPATLIKETRSK